MNRRIVSEEFHRDQTRIEPGRGDNYTKEVKLKGVNTTKSKSSKKNKCVVNKPPVHTETERKMADNIKQKSQKAAKSTQNKKSEEWKKLLHENCLSDAHESFDDDKNTEDEANSSTKPKRLSARLNNLKSNEISPDKKSNNNLPNDTDAMKIPREKNN